jgi:hypothetical protein
METINKASDLQEKVRYLLRDDVSHVYSNMPADLKQLLVEIVDKLYLKFIQITTIYGVEIYYDSVTYLVRHNGHLQTMVLSESYVWECEACEVANRLVVYIMTLRNILSSYYCNSTWEYLRDRLIYLQQRVNNNALWYCEVLLSYA